jgi:methionyl aminopeptidase
MTIDSDEDLQQLLQIGKIVAIILRDMMRQTEPGMSTLELDQIGEKLLDHYGARSAPKLTYNFPGYTCISINEEAAHGVPGARIIQPGDIVNIDVSAEKGGYFADTGGSFVVPPSTALKDRLLRATQRALSQACLSAQANRPLNGIGQSIEKVAKQKGYKIIKNLCGHGVGLALHEEPIEITGFYDRGDKRKLHEGLVISIEPFLSTISEQVSESDDGWTLVGAANNLSAQFEHSMVITQGEPIILTLVE